MLQRAIPRLLLLVACIVYLSSSLLAVNTGIFSISKVVYPQHDRAVAEFQAQSFAQYKEELLYGRVDNLLSTQLNRGFMETHQDCLARGLEQADYELFGLAWQYPDIRTQVMDWTMENCGRLQYTPQVVAQHPTPQQTVLTYWADAKYRSRRMLEGALGAIRQQARHVWIRLSSAFLDNKSASITKHVSVSANTTTAPFSIRSLPKVPFGFALSCDPLQSCRLVYPPVPSLHSDQVTISPKALAKLKRQTEVLHAFCIHLDKGLWATGRLVSILDQVIHLLETIILASLIGSILYMAVTRTYRTPRKMKTKFALRFMHVFCAGKLVLDSFFKYPIDVPYDELKVFLGLFMLLVGLSMLVQFFVTPSPKLENVNLVYTQIKELYLIARGCEVPDDGFINMLTYFGILTQEEDPEPKPVEDLTTDADTTSSFSDDDQQRYHSPEPYHRLAFPTTSFQEDIDACAKAYQHLLNAQQAMDFDVESESDTETELDSEEGSFVDLASGVTPNLTDVESGWSVVDA
jgi:hypothetical protein